MKNFVQNGRYLTAFGVTPAMDSGEGRVIGGIFGVAVADIANNGDGVLDTEGVYSLKKAESVTPVQFAPAYWNATAKEVTTTSAGNQQIGIFNKAAGAAAATVEVLLDKGLGGKDEMVVSFSRPGAGALPAAATFFIAPVAMKVLKVSAVFGTKNTAAQTADIHKDTGTDAPGAGTAVLLGDDKLALGDDAVANTVQSPALSATAASLLLAPGDRLCLKPSITGTQIADLAVTVHLARA